MPGLPAHVHPAVHAVVAAQQTLSATARAAFLAREHASEKRLGSVSVLFMSSRLFIPAHATVLHFVFLAVVHDADDRITQTAHPTPRDMLERLRNGVKVHWDSMAADAEHHYRTCGRCQHVAAGSQPVKVGRMGQFLYAAPNHVVYIDIIGELPSCKRRNPLDPTGMLQEYRYLFILVDAYSRLALGVPATHKSSDAAVASYRQWCTYYGIPRVMRSDCDKAFAADSFRAALAVTGSKHDQLPPHSPQQRSIQERGNHPLLDTTRRVGGLAIREWIDYFPLMFQWRNTSANRHFGLSPHRMFFSRQPYFAYERLGINDVGYVTPNDLANVCAALDVWIGTAAAASSAAVAAQYDSERDPPPTYASGDTVLLHFPTQESKINTAYKGPFEVLGPSASVHSDPGTYYRCRDMVQGIEYDAVHVERMKRFDMSRTTLEAQAARQLPSRDFDIVVGIDAHRMNEAHGHLEFCIRFYSGYRAWQLYPDVCKLDVVTRYVAAHSLDVRKRTPAQQLLRLSGQHVAPRQASRRS